MKKDRPTPPAMQNLTRRQRFFESNGHLYTPRRVAAEFERIRLIKQKGKYAPHFLSRAIDSLNTDIQIMKLPSQKQSVFGSMAGAFGRALHKNRMPKAAQRGN